MPQLPVGHIEAKLHAVTSFWRRRDVEDTREDNARGHWQPLVYCLRSTRYLFVRYSKTTCVGARAVCGIVVSPKKPARAALAHQALLPSTFWWRVGSG